VLLRHAAGSLRFLLPARLLVDIHVGANAFLGFGLGIRCQVPDCQGQEDSYLRSVAMIVAGSFITMLWAVVMCTVFVPTTRRCLLCLRIESF